MACSKMVAGQQTFKDMAAGILGKILYGRNCHRSGLGLSLERENQLYVLCDNRRSDIAVQFRRVSRYL